MMRSFQDTCDISCMKSQVVLEPSELYSTHSKGRHISQSHLAVEAGAARHSLGSEAPQQVYPSAFAVETLCCLPPKPFHKQVTCKHKLSSSLLSAKKLRSLRISWWNSRNHQTASASRTSWARSQRPSKGPALRGTHHIRVVPEAGLGVAPDP